MYCPNCGVYNEYSRIFCKSCNTQLKHHDTGVSKDSYITKSVMPLKILSFIFTAIMLTLSLTKIYCVEYVFGDEYVYGFKFIKLLGSKDIIDTLQLKIYLFCLVIVNAWLPLSLVSYFITEAGALNKPEYDSVPIKGHGAMMSAFVCILAGQTVMYLANTNCFKSWVFSFSPWIYIIFVLAIINRFVILPKYLRNIQFNTRAKKIYEKAASGGKSILTSEPERETTIKPRRLKEAPTYQPFAPDYTDKRRTRPTNVTTTFTKYDSFESPSFEPTATHTVPTVPPPEVTKPHTSQNTPDTWQCFGCGMHNNPHDSVCRGCGSPK